MLLGWGLCIGELGRRNATLQAPAGPDAITLYTLDDDGDDGTLVFTVNTPPSAGDGAAAGDGLGSITGYQWRPEASYPVWFDLAGAGPHTLSSPLLAGETLTPQFRALGYQGRAGAITTAASTTVPGAAVDVIYLVAADGDALFAADGKRLVVLVPTV
jgi:hypothetical protein